MSSRSRPLLLAGLIRPANRVIKRLAGEQLTLITAESCTAGLIAAALSNGEGASGVLHGGFVVYTKTQKTKALNVSAALLKREGSVSEKVVRAMAAGALRRSSADIALAVSGVLGPAPDEDGNPIGLVWFCCACRGGKTRVVKKSFRNHGHRRLTIETVCSGFELINEVVEDGCHAVHRK